MHVPVWGVKWLGCHAGHQEVSRCHTRSESEESMQQSRQLTDPQGRHHQKSKPGISLAPQKGLVSNKNFSKMPNTLCSINIRKISVNIRTASIKKTLNLWNQKVRMRHHCFCAIKYQLSVRCYSLGKVPSKVHVQLKTRIYCFLLKIYTEWVIIIICEISNTTNHGTKILQIPAHVIIILSLLLQI